MQVPWKSVENADIWCWRLETVDTFAPWA